MKVGHPSPLYKSVRRQILSQRIWILAVAHVCMFALSYELAHQLRFEWAVPPPVRTLFWQTLPFVLFLKLAVFYGAGSYHGWWRYVTFADLASLLKASFISSAVLATVDYLFFPGFQVSHAVVTLDWCVTILLVGGMRSLWRIFNECVMVSWSNQGSRPAFLIGAGSQGDGLVRQIHANPRLNYKIVGFFDENRALLGSQLGGIPFLDTPEHVVDLAQQMKVKDVLLLAKSIAGPQLRRLMDSCRDAGLQLKIIPPVDEWINHSYRLSLRDVDINDLLRRPPVQLDTEHIREMLTDKQVMVTGAGGSIGSEICRQIMLHEPSSLILVERFENNLFNIERELVAQQQPVKIVPCVADIRDEERMRAIFAAHRPDIVFHAAAHKHVPLMEDNPGEAVKNNILGTVALVDMVEEFNVERFVMISTDKAVNPTSVMGVTKQMAERYVHACSETSNTKFVAVRFGNVLASAGSVVPIFQEQIRRGGPVTVTHPEMRRYFMTIPEASQLVLQAASMGKGGEIFVLDMGEPVKILDLAKDLIRLSGLSPEQIDIQITGSRPGEKLFEELYLDDEQTLPTPHPKLKVAYHRSYTREEVLASIEELMPYVHGSQAELRAQLKKIAPEYAPPEHLAVGAENRETLAAEGTS